MLGADEDEKANQAGRKERTDEGRKEGRKEKARFSKLDPSSLWSARMLDGTSLLHTCSPLGEPVPAVQIAHKHGRKIRMDTLEQERKVLLTPKFSSVLFFLLDFLNFGRK